MTAQVSRNDFRSQQAAPVPQICCPPSDVMELATFHIAPQNFRIGRMPGGGDTRAGSGRMIDVIGGGSSRTTRMHKSHRERDGGQTAREEGENNLVRWLLQRRQPVEGVAGANNRGRQRVSLRSQCERDRSKSAHKRAGMLRASEWAQGNDSPPLAQVASQRARNNNRATRRSMGAFVQLSVQHALFCTLAPALVRSSVCSFARNNHKGGEQKRGSE